MKSGWCVKATMWEASARVASLSALLEPCHLAVEILRSPLRVLEETRVQDDKVRGVLAEGVVVGAEVGPVARQARGIGHLVVRAGVVVTGHVAERDALRQRGGDPLHLGHLGGIAGGVHHVAAHDHEPGPRGARHRDRRLEAARLLPEVRHLRRRAHVEAVTPVAGEVFRRAAGEVSELAELRVGHLHEGERRRHDRGD